MDEKRKIIEFPQAPHIHQQDSLEIVEAVVTIKGLEAFHRVTGRLQPVPFAQGEQRFR